MQYLFTHYNMKMSKFVVMHKMATWMGSL